jgi:hypothetical protein
MWTVKPVTTCCEVAAATTFSTVVRVSTGEYLVGIENDLGTTLTTSLTGAEEIDAETGEGGAGDPDGSGSATVTVSLNERTVCSDIAVADIGLPAAGAHIHEAEVGSNGPIVVTLDHPGDDGTDSGCVEGVARSLLRDILIDPDHYYVNVHNAEYPAGAPRPTRPTRLNPATTTAIEGAGLGV